VEEGKGGSEKEQVTQSTCDCPGNGPHCLTPSPKLSSLLYTDIKRSQKFICLGQKSTVGSPV
jgi:hypothetical protein